jgi:hypothetical protein
MIRVLGSIRCAAVGSIVVVATSAVLATDPPDSKVNPVSGFIEVVDTTAVGSNDNVRHTINPGGGQSLTLFDVATDSLDDLSPRITISPSGDTWVTWWRDASTKQVLVRKKTYATGAWGSERLVSDSTASSKNPEIVHDGTNPWIAYESPTSGTTQIAVAAVIDDPEPMVPVAISSTSFGGNVDVLIHAQSSGNLWVTWVDSTTYVGWSEYSYANHFWSSPGYESYASDSIAAARARIRTTVLGD